MSPKFEEQYSIDRFAQIEVVLKLWKIRPTLSKNTCVHVEAIKEYSKFSENTLVPIESKFLVKHQFLFIPLLRTRPSGMTGSYSSS